MMPSDWGVRHHFVDSRDVGRLAILGTFLTSVVCTRHECNPIFSLQLVVVSCASRKTLPQCCAKLYHIVKEPIVLHKLL